MDEKMEFQELVERALKRMENKEYIVVRDELDTNSTGDCSYGGIVGGRCSVPAVPLSGRQTELR